MIKKIYDNKTLVSTYGSGAGGEVHQLPEMNSDTIFHIFDVFDADFLQKCYKKKGKPGCIISDHLVYQKDLVDHEIQFYGLPLWLERERKQWNLSEFDQLLPETIKTFNFMINKKQTSRFLCCKLVDIFFAKLDYYYTFSGVGRKFDCTKVINEMNMLEKQSPLTELERSQILEPVLLDTHFIESSTTIISQLDQGNSYGRIYYGGNKTSWNSINQIFLNTGVALITETVDFQKSAVFTEKTLFSLLGLNFPIWVGGYQQADTWKKLGFDIFDDLIDHSYQYHDTLIERCVYAIKNNLDILSNLNLVKDLRKIHLQRLLENRYKILNGQLEKYIDEVVNTASVDYQPMLNETVDRFKRSTTNMC